VGCAGPFSHSLRQKSNGIGTDKHHGLTLPQLFNSDASLVVVQVPREFEQWE
jgi:hypothetical protein